MQTFYKVCLILMIIGGINWGLVGLFQFDFVGWLLGGSSSIWSRIVFTVVGVAAVCGIHSPHDLADGGAVLGQVGLAAARVGKQDLAQMAHHQRQRQQLGGFGVVVVTGISGGLVDLLGRKAPAQQAAGLLYAQVAVQHAGAVADDRKGET